MEEEDTLLKVWNKKINGEKRKKGKGRAVKGKKKKWPKNIIFVYCMS